MYLNNVQIIGNLTRDLELKALPSGTNVVNGSLATNRTYTVDGEKKEDTQFHNFVAFGKTADILNQYAVKGQQLYIEGRLQTRSWEKDGEKRYSTEIIVENFQFGQKPKGSEGKQETKGEDTHTSPDEDGNVINLEDLPF